MALRITHLPMACLLLACALLLAANAAAAPNSRIIEWGWGTPDPVYIRDHVREMEQMPFDGLVLDLPANGMRPNTGTWFAWQVWGRRTLRAKDYQEAMDALKATSFERFTDNFLRFNVTPGDVEWTDSDFPIVLLNARLAARIAKECGLKGLLFDVEHYSGRPFNFSGQGNIARLSFHDYAELVQARGREFMRAINTEYPGITLLLTYGYHIAFHKFTRSTSLESAEYGLLPAFLDGMVEAAAPETLIFDGWEYAYGYKDELQFKQAYDTMTREGMGRSANNESLRRHYRASFGLWVDNQKKWDTADFSKNYFSPEEFEQSVRLALKHTDRYVWIYSEKANWWNGTIPPAYIDALARARRVITTP